MNKMAGRNTGRLTKRQAQVFRCIIEYQENHGFSPSIRDLCRMTGLKSSSSVHFHLKVLEEGGYIERVRDCPRTVAVLK